MKLQAVLSRLFFAQFLLVFVACQPQQSTVSTASSGAVPLNNNVTIPTDLGALLHTDGNGNVSLSNSASDSPLANFHIYPLSTLTDTILRVSTSSSSKAILQFYSSSDGSGWSAGYDPSNTDRFYLQHSSQSSPSLIIYPSGVNQGVIVSGSATVDTLTVNTTLSAPSASVRASYVDVGAAAQGAPVSGALYGDTLTVGGATTIGGALTVINNATINGNLTATSGNATLKNISVSGNAAFTGSTTFGASSYLTIDSLGNFTSAVTGWSQFGPSRLAYTQSAANAAGCTGLSFATGGNFSSTGISATSYISGTATLTTKTAGNAVSAAVSYLSGLISAPSVLPLGSVNSGALTAITINTATGAISSVTCAEAAMSATQKLSLDLYVVAP